MKKVKISSNHIELNLFNHHEVLEDLAFYQKSKISLIGYGALNHLSMPLTKIQQDFLDSLQKRYNKTKSQILIRYFTSFENIILLSRTDSIDHLDNNLHTFDFDITEKERNRFKDIFQYKIQHIPVKKIKIPPNFNKTNFEILQNPDDLIPSPFVIAQAFVSYYYFKPIKLLKKKDYYYLDNYDFYGELKKYLSWKLLHNDTTPIPAIVI